MVWDPTCIPARWDQSVSLVTTHLMAQFGSRDSLFHGLDLLSYRTLCSSKALRLLLKSPPNHPYTTRGHTTYPGRRDCSLLPLLWLLFWEDTYMLLCTHTPVPSGCGVLGAFPLWDPAHFCLLFYLYLISNLEVKEEEGAHFACMAGVFLLSSPRTGFGF